MALRPDEMPAVDFLKIDSEGHDLFALQGFTWERFKPAVIQSELEDAKRLLMGYLWQNLVEFLYRKSCFFYLSEWHPTIVYGTSSEWHQLSR